jgi:hypothetical protein
MMYGTPGHLAMLVALAPERPGIDQLEVKGPDQLIPRKRRLWQAVSSR